MLSKLLSWPGIGRRTIAQLLPDGAPRRALVIDPRFSRPLRALGHTVVVPPATDDRVELICAGAPAAEPNKAAAGDETLLALVRGYAGSLGDGGMVILRCSASQRQRVAAAFLHAGLRDVEQTKSGRGFLTAGMI
jgi:hypothetical protein